MTEVEIERLQTDKASISQTASGYLHELERLQTVIEMLNGAYIRRVEELAAAQADIERLREILGLKT